MPDPTRQFLRHTVATVAYRGSKALRGAPESFAQYGAPEKSAVQILAHIGDLYDWALSKALGQEKWRNATPLPWSGEVARFHKTLATFDEYLASDKPLHASAEELFQGPIADSLTHIGQLAMMRRLAGCKMSGENYAVATIKAGQCGPDQPAPKREF